MLRQRLPGRLRRVLLRARTFIGKLTWSLHRFDPVSRRIADANLPVDVGGCARVLLVAVYRERNAEHVVPLVREAVDRGWSLRLWALDHIPDQLAAWTVGSGPGDRSRLLNELLREPFDWAVVIDDDIQIARGSLALLLAFAATAGLELAQAAHAPDSAYTYAITKVRPLRYVRSTTYVEIGPALVISATAADRVLPFEPGVGMGWGADVDWALLARRGLLRCGVVDAVVIRHLAPVADAYGRDEALRRLEAFLANRGLRDVRSIQETRGSWFVWQSRPAEFTVDSDGPLG